MTSGGLAGRAAPLRPSPDLGDRRTGGHLAQHSVRRLYVRNVRVFIERCCPSHSPTLRPWTTIALINATTSYVEERWSPVLEVTFGNCRYNRTPEISGANSEQHRDLLSQTGPQLQSELLQAEHHLVGFQYVADCLQTQKRRPTRSPSLRLLCTPVVLACTPRCEGRDISEPTLRAELMPARHRRRHGRRFGQSWLDVDGTQH